VSLSLLSLVWPYSCLPWRLSLSGEMLMCHECYKIALFCGLSPPLDKSRTVVTVRDNVKIEEAAQPYAEIDWLVTFPTIVTDAHHKRLILYTAALCRARAAVIDDCMINCKWNFDDYLLDPYEVATCEIQDLHNVTTCDAYAIFSLLIAFSHDSGGVITFTFLFSYDSWRSHYLYVPTHVICVSAIVLCDSRVTGCCASYCSRYLLSL
jgi:hypothetical protein